MNHSNYLNGYIYHMVHFNNLSNIFRHNALISKEKVLQKKIFYQSIAFESVQDLRNRIFLWSEIERQFRLLHSYVPFYFATHTPMLYIQYEKGIQEQIVIFEVPRSIIREPSVLFTDGNASNQQLAKYRNEVVEITPATVSHNSCCRKYNPIGPLGTNSNVSCVYSGVPFLSNLNWEVINSKKCSSKERKRIKHAEVLVPDMFPLGRIQGISVSTQAMVRSVNTLIVQFGLKGRVPLATFKPDLFFH